MYNKIIFYVTILINLNQLFISAENIKHVKGK